MLVLNGEENIWDHHQGLEESKRPIFTHKQGRQAIRVHKKRCPGVFETPCACEKYPRYTSTRMYEQHRVGTKIDLARGESTIELT